MAILGLKGACLSRDDEDCDGDNTVVGSGTGESGDDGGDDGMDRDSDGTVMVTGTACAQLLLWVGSEEETDGCAWDSLRWFGRVLNNSMVGAVCAPLRKIRSDQF